MVSREQVLWLRQPHGVAEAHEGCGGDDGGRQGNGACGSVEVYA